MKKNLLLTSVLLTTTFPILNINNSSLQKNVVNTRDDWTNQEKNDFQNQKKHKYLEINDYKNNREKEKSTKKISKQFLKIPTNALSMEFEEIYLKANAEVTTVSTWGTIPQIRKYPISTTIYFNNENLKWARNQILKLKEITFAWEGWWKLGTFYLKAWIEENPNIQNTVYEGFHFLDYSAEFKKMTVNINYNYLMPVGFSTTEFKLREYFTKSYDLNVKTIHNGSYVLQKIRYLIINFLPEKWKFAVAIDLWNKNYQELNTYKTKKWLLSIKIDGIEISGESKEKAIYLQLININ